MLKAWCGQQAHAACRQDNLLVWCHVQFWMSMLSYPEVLRQVIAGNSLMHMQLAPSAATCIHNKMCTARSNLKGRSGS